VTDGSLSGYKLVWRDEFDGASVNTSEWHYRTGERFWSTQRPENVSVAAGKLRLALKKEKFGASEYTAGGIISKREFKFGFYEARIKMPRGKGWHTSFWMMRNSNDRDQELDVCEQDSINPNDYTTNVHAYKPAHKALVVDTRDVANVPLGDASIWLTSIAGPLGKTDKVDDSALPAFAEFDYVRFFEKAESDEAQMKRNAAGKVSGCVRNGTYTYKGIPYAAPVAGAARFMPPAKPKPWAGVRSSLQYGQVSPQVARTGWANDEEAWLFSWDDGIPGEDCLRVNVWMPGINDNKKRPVMVWLHGGGFQAGSGQDGDACGQRVVSQSHCAKRFGLAHGATRNFVESRGSGVV